MSAAAAEALGSAAEPESEGFALFAPPPKKNSGGPACLGAENRRPDAVLDRRQQQQQSKAKHEHGEKAAVEASGAAGFAGLGLDPWLVEAVHGLAIHRPSPVQAACIPAILAGRPVVACAKTGTGKTAAFALPILQELARNPHGHFALVLTPTRELALQIAEQFQALGRAIKLSVCVAVGGLGTPPPPYGSAHPRADMMSQAIELANRPHIIVATPGRLLDLLTSSRLTLHRLRFLVFDEADRLLAPASSICTQEIPQILPHVAGPRTAWLFFSATMSAAVSRFQRQHCLGAEPLLYDGNPEFGTVDALDQRFILVPSLVRDAHLASLLSTTLATKTMIVFVGRCKTCELLLHTLRGLKIQAVALHSQMSQRDRLASLARFKSGAVPRLISTDVGSRGLDIPAVEFVVNFDLPADARDYVHRVGRAARAGRVGTAVSFVNELDMDVLAGIEAKIGRKLLPYPDAPMEADIVKILNTVSTAKRNASMALHDRKFGEKAQINKKKWARVA